MLAELGGCLGNTRGCDKERIGVSRDLRAWPTAGCVTDARRHPRPAHVKAAMVLEVALFCKVSF